MNFTAGQSSNPLPTPSRHWAFDLIGKPWTVDGFGPDCFNCWGLVCWIYAQRYGIELPKYLAISPRELARAIRAFEGASHSPDWKALQKPLDGCVVAMSSHKQIHHVGVYLAIEGGRVLHASDGQGVLCQSIPGLRASGYSRISFYLFHQWPIS